MSNGVEEGQKAPSANSNAGQAQSAPSAQSGMPPASETKSKPHEKLHHQKGKETPLKQALHPVVQALQDLAPKKEPPKKLERFAECLKVIRSVILDGIIIVLCALLIIGVCRELRSDRVVVGTFGAPSEFEKLGYSQKAIANIVVGKCNAIIRGTRTSAQLREIRLDDHESFRDIEVPETHISLKLLVNFINDLFGHRPTTVSGDFLGATNELSLSLHVDGVSSPDVSSIPKLSLDKMDSLLDYAATNILMQTHPYIMGVNFYEHHQFDAALEMISACNKHGTTEEKARAQVLWGAILISQHDYNGAIKHIVKATNNASAAGMAFVQLALASIEVKNYDMALKYADRVIKLKPSELGGFQVRGWIYYRRGAYDSSVADFTRAVELNPEESTSYHARALARHSLKDEAGAIEDCMMAIRLNPNDAYAFNNLGFIKSANSEYHDAINDFTKAIELDSFLDMAYVNRATAKRLIRDYNGAMSDLTSAIQIDSKNAEAYRQLAMVHNKLNETNAALKAINTAVSLESDEARSHSFRAIIFYSLNDVAKAIDEFAIAIKLDPSNSDYYVQRASINAALKNTNQALDDLREAIKLDPNNAEAYSRRSTFEAETGNNSGAIFDAAHAIQLDPTSVEAYNSHGLAMLRNSDPRGAAQDFAKEVQLDPKGAIGYINLGLAEMALKDYTNAMINFSNAVALDSREARAYGCIGDIKVELNDLQGTELAYTKGIAIDPSRLELYYSRGTVRLGLDTNNVNQAMSDFDTAISLAPASGEAYFRRGKAAAELGRYEPAIKDLTEAIKYSPTNAEIYRARALSETCLASMCETNVALNHYVTSPHVELNPQASMPEIQFKLGSDNASHLSERAREHYMKAISDLRQAVHFSPDLISAYADINVVTQAVGDFQGAKEACDCIVKLRPSDELGYGYRSDVEFELNDFVASINDLTTAISLNPTNSTSYYNRGFSKAKLKMFESAITDYTKALELAPKRADALYNRGLANFELERYDAAVNDITKALKIDPTIVGAYHYIAEAEEKLKTKRKETR